MSLAVYYDGECPFCSRYVTAMRLRNAIGQVQLVDLRTNAQARRRFAETGLNVNEGMVVEYGGRVYFGADAIALLASLSSPVGTFNRLNGFLLRSPSIARVVYPLLKAGRRFALFLLRRKLIET
jgi:predicted DCC family thiol-disulfide oxidoreductase YuxK